MGMYMPAEIVGWSPDMVRFIFILPTPRATPTRLSQPRTPDAHARHVHYAAADPYGRASTFYVVVVLAPTLNPAFLSSELVAVNDQKAYQS